MIQWMEINSQNHGELEATAKQWNVHPLALQDCVNRDQRPKLEDYDLHQFLVWFMLAKEKIYEVQFLIFEDKLIMVPHDPPPSGTTWQEYLRIDLNQKDVWHLLYQALDRATDVTWNEVKRLFNEIDTFEQQLFEIDSDPQLLLLLKKQLNQIDYSIGHLASVAHQIQNYHRFKDDLRWKFRDLHDHCERIYQSISLYRSQIATTIELYWGLQAHRTGKQVKKLSILASIALPLSFWTSFWGMNFTAIPFANSQLFYLALGLMAASVLITSLFLIKKGYWS